jgi:PIN domain nuclease of toxin-antitoxin system
LRIADEDNEIFLSAVSAWEIAIKASNGRLALPEPATQGVTSRLQIHRFSSLPIQLAHALRVAPLRHHHADLFDRLWVGQRLVEDLPLLAADKTLKRYRAKVVG